MFLSNVVSKVFDGATKYQSFHPPSPLVDHPPVFSTWGNWFGLTARASDEGVGDESRVVTHRDSTPR